MADLPLKRHPLQEHTDRMRSAADAVDQYFKDQVQMQGDANAIQKGKSKSPAAQALGIESGP